MQRFRDAYSFSKRAQECKRIRERFPGRVPIILERALFCGDVPEIEKHKFLVPSDMTVGQFIFVVRKHLVLPPERALFVFVGSVLPPTGALLKEVYAQYADPDGFLYAVYAGENTFGCCL